MVKLTTAIMMLWRQLKEKSFREILTHRNKVTFTATEFYRRFHFICSLRRWI